jgi:hypothetical protein
MSQVASSNTRASVPNPQNSWHVRVDTAWTVEDCVLNELVITLWRRWEQGYEKTETPFSLANWPF